MIAGCWRERSHTNNNKRKGKENETRKSAVVSELIAMNATRRKKLLFLRSAWEIRSTSSVPQPFELCQQKKLTINGQLRVTYLWVTRRPLRLLLLLHLNLIYELGVLSSDGSAHFTLCSYLSFVIWKNRTGKKKKVESNHIISFLSALLANNKTKKATITTENIAKNKQTTTIKCSK